MASKPKITAMYPDLECLILSGYEEFELARAAIDKGVRGYLLKPRSKEVIEEKIKNIVERLDGERVERIYQYEQRQQNNLTAGI